MSKDYYKTLGVEKGASSDEIKKAFRKLAHQHHPDKQGGDSAKFKEASEAYSVLSDDKKRAQYDQFGSGAFGGGSGSSGGAGHGGAGQGGFGGFEGFDFSGFGFGNQGQANSQNFEFDLGDLFGSMFSGGGRRGSNRKKRGSDIQVDIDISFKESIFGLDKEIQLTKDSLCSHCKGSRAEPGTDMNNCGTCHGSGQVIKQQRTILGTIENAVECDTCNGTGKIPKTKCNVCKGKGLENKREAISVVVPSGIENGETLRVIGAGVGIVGGDSGDLFIRINVKQDSDATRFKKNGYDLYADLSISISDAVLGGEAKFEHLDENFTVKIPEGIEHGEILRVKGKGVPHTRAKPGVNSKDVPRGELMLKVLVKIPKKLSRDSRKLFEELRKNEK